MGNGLILKLENHVNLLFRMESNYLIQLNVKSGYGKSSSVELLGHEVFWFLLLLKGDS